MAGEAARMQRREHAAAHTISCALIVHRRALVRWPGKWSHIKVSGHIGLIPHGSVAYGTCFTETEERATMPQLYDTLGVGYGSYRRPDPRIAAAIMGALGEFAPIVNVGEGTGSYEPSDRLVVAVEPSRAMIRQRQARMIPVVQASAVHLPFRHAAFAAALAVLTIHHWSDRERGLAELARVARHRLVIVTYDPAATGFWLVADYFPAIGEIDRQILPSLEEFRRAVWPVDIRPLPIPHDCTDGFLGAYWRRPYAYLDPGVRRAISTFAKVPHIDAGLTRLRADLADGTWARRYGYLLHQTALDIGYRLVIAHLGSRGTTEGYESQANRCIRERDTVIQEGTIRGAAQGLRAEKAGLPSHISNDKYDEGCRPSATGPYPRGVSSCGRNPDDDGG